MTIDANRDGEIAKHDANKQPHDQQHREGVNQVFDKLEKLLKEARALVVGDHAVLNATDGVAGRNPVPR